MNTNFQTIHQMGNAVSEMVRQATGRNSVQSMDMDWVTVEQTKKWIYGEDSGDIVSFVTNLRNGITQLIASIMPVQDLHGYDTPWVGGAGKNLVNPDAFEAIRGASVTITGNEIHCTGDGSQTYQSVRIKAETQTYSAGTYYTKFKVKGTPTINADTKLSLRNASGVVKASISIVSGTSTYSGTLTVEEDCYLSIILNNTTEDPIDLTLYDLIISTTDVPYEPYSNICPIYGWNMCNVFITGKNLLNPDEFTEGYYINDSGVMTESQYGTVSGLIPAKVGKIYALSGKATENSAGYRSITGYDSEGNFIQQWKLTGMAPAGAGYGMVVNNTNPLIKMFRITFFKDVDINVQFEITTSMETAYEEFTGNTYTAIWSDEDPGVVYYGTLDVITGILTVEWESRTIGDLTWSRTEENGVVSYRHNETTKKGGYSNIICSHYRTGRSGDSGEFTITGRSANRNIYIVDSRFNSTDDWLADVGTGTYIFQLATPSTYQLDPNTVESITEINYVMADTGTVSVEYRHEEEMP